MPTYVAFLRAVNVGKRPYPMAALRVALEAAGFTDVATHIQSGNVRVSSSMRSSEKVAATLEQTFAAERGFEVATIVLTPAELTGVVDDAEKLSEQDPPGVGHYVELLGAPAGEEATALVEGVDRPGCRYRVRGRAVHMLLDVPFHEMKPLPAAVRRAMGASTNRNLTVLRTLRERWAV